LHQLYLRFLPSFSQLGLSIHFSLSFDTLCFAKTNPSFFTSHTQLSNSCIKMLYSTATVALFASMMPLASAHYFFDRLVVNGVASGDYVRSNTRSIAYMPTKWKNTFDNLTPDDTDFRCNLGATNKGSKATAKVKAGDSLAMTLGVGATMRHPGPAQVYLSKAPTTAGAYDGSGDWFKIHQETVCKPSGDIKMDAWCTWDKDRVSFQLPANIPDGEYLVRAEHIGLHGAHDGQAEFYYGCAQLSVSGGAGSLPTEGLVKIPGVYKKTDPEVNYSVWGNTKSYPAQGPGPKVFDGKTTTPTKQSNDGAASPIASAKPIASTAPVASAAPVASPSSSPVASPVAKPEASVDPTKCNMFARFARRHARAFGIAY
jgi:hypothetical protein